MTETARGQADQKLRSWLQQDNTQKDSTQDDSTQKDNSCGGEQHTTYSAKCVRTLPFAQHPRRSRGGQ